MVFSVDRPQFSNAKAPEAPTLLEELGQKWYDTTLAGFAYWK